MHLEKHVSMMSVENRCGPVEALPRASRIGETVYIPLSNLGSSKNNNHGYLSNINANIERLNHAQRGHSCSHHPSVRTKSHKRLRWVYP
jgi:hypothetical protein